jgi:hypothetical protein
MVRTRHGRGMASVNQTRSHCVNQMGKTHSKPLAARHGRGTTWARQAMCESAFTVLFSCNYKIRCNYVCGRPTRTGSGPGDFFLNLPSKGGSERVKVKIAEGIIFKMVSGRK